MRGVTYYQFSLLLQQQFQLTRLMRGVTVIDEGTQQLLKISTHTPHARRDCYCQEQSALTA